MSHQVKQVGAIAIVNLDFLARAAECVEVKQLETHLVLNMERKTAVFWEGNEQECDGVITFARKLEGEEVGRYYDIALKVEEKKDASEAEKYGLWADTFGHDHTMQSRIDELFQRYKVEELKSKGYEKGAVTVSEVAEEIDGMAGWKLVEVEMPD